MDDKIILLCDGTPEGIFTAIYDGFCIKNKRYGRDGKNYNDNIQICVTFEYTIDMFAEYVQVKTDSKKAFSTADAIRDKIGEQAYNMVIAALCHYSDERGTVIFGFLIRGFKMGAKICNMLSDQYVIRMVELARKTGNEAHYFKEFVRFKDMGETLYSVIEPKCDVLPLIGEHFSDRFPCENWIIYDRKKRTAALHKRYGGWMIVSGNEINGEYLEKSYENEGEYERMWKAFFSALSIKERTNKKCQNNNIPKWYRSNMVEFKTVSE